MTSSAPDIPITNIKIRLVENGTNGLLAWASCVVSGAIKLDNIAIRRSKDGSLYLTYPAKLTSGGKKYHYFNPISAEAASTVKEALMSQVAALAMTKVRAPVENSEAQ